MALLQYPGCQIWTALNVLALSQFLKLHKWLGTFLLPPLIWSINTSRGLVMVSGGVRVDYPDQRWRPMEPSQLINKTATDVVARLKAIFSHQTIFLYRSWRWSLKCYEDIEHQVRIYLRLPWLSFEQASTCYLHSDDFPPKVQRVSSLWGLSALVLFCCPDFPAPQSSVTWGSGLIWGLQPRLHFDWGKLTHS